MKILFLAVRMSKGFGVSVVIEELCLHLGKIGISTIVGCLESDSSFRHSNTKIMPPDVNFILSFVKENKIDFVIAHTYPYFELLPLIQMNVECWAWEHGEPSPSFFPDDKVEDGETNRRKRAEYKLKNVYPAIAGVIAISEFVASDILWPRSEVIFNGCDHVPDQCTKPRIAFMDTRPLRIGTLMRFGKGEALYKGNEYLLKIAEYLKKRGLSITFEVMGRGTEEDVEEFTKQGIKAHLNASDAERSNFLRSLDIFLSCSLWEGFNLPLVEAQASGTVSLALDVGSHPEVTPFVCKDLTDMCRRVEAYCSDRDLLCAHSQLAYRFVRNKFSWDIGAFQFVQLICSRYSNNKFSCYCSHPKRNITIKAYAYLKKHEVVQTAKKIARFLLKKIFKP